MIEQVHVNGNLMWKLNLLLDDGYRLTYLGYDFLAIKTMVNKGVFVAVGRQIGVGKESGWYLF
jgi:RIO-like serine/threonine protein kinase